MLYSKDIGIYFYTIRNINTCELWIMNDKLWGMKYKLETFLLIEHHLKISSVKTKHILIGPLMAHSLHMCAIIRFILYLY